MSSHPASSSAAASDRGESAAAYTPSERRAMERLWEQHVHDFSELRHADVDEDGSVFEVHRCACGQEEYALTEEIAS